MIVWLAGSLGSISASTLVLLPDYRESIQQTLEKAGGNQKELSKALSLVPENQSKGMQFLIAYMPEHDSKHLNADFLLKNVALAYKARETFPWAKDVPEDIFLNDILPYALLNERRDNWRQDFFDRFSKHVEGVKTQGEAIKAVNAAIQNEVKVKYNTKRKKPDQSPYESMEQGMASCTGLSILLSDAFRAVGIPSRIVGIPLWTTMRGNHNWVEVWVADQNEWMFTEYNPSQKGLNHGWFLGHAAKANEASFLHSVYASSWKTTGKHFPLVWDMKRKDVPAVNVTQRYVELGGGKPDEKLCELRVQFWKGDRRVAVPLMVMQGDVMIKQGSSPKPTDDLNRFFTAGLKKGQIYQVRWRDPETGKIQVKQISIPKDKNWFLIKLPDGEVFDRS